MKRFLRVFFLTLLSGTGVMLGPVRADVIISEVLADNVTGIADENSNREDWIELYNTGASAVSLSGWWLTDNSSNKTQWEFPNVSIAAGGTVFVWASGKDRRVAGQALHTNFSLKKSGEYVGLFKPNAQGLPELVSEIAPAFPVLPSDVSYGRSMTQTTATLVASGTTGRYKVLANDSTGQSQYSGTNYAGGDVGTNQTGGWNMSPTFNDSAWTAGATGIGYDRDQSGVSLLPWITTNCESALYNVNPSLLFRVTFTLANPSAYSSYKLRMKYEDGFVAFVNGQQVGVQNFSGTLAYNSTASAALTETIVNSWTESTIPSSALVSGTNVLAIQGLNSSRTSSDFLLLPEVTGSTGVVVGSPVFFSTPTPAAVNGVGTAGPLLYDARPADPSVPRPSGTAASPPLALSVHVIKTQYNISYVRAYSRVMYNTETGPLTLLDNGVSPDATAGDGIYTANLATNTLAASQMLRWRFESADTNGNVTKLPSYLSTTDSPQYFGTVAVNPNPNPNTSGTPNTNTNTSGSLLPVLEWFVEGAPTNGPTASAFRGSCYLLNRFYDNIGHEIHGQSTAGFAKKSYDFDSNTGFRFVWKEGENEVKDLNLLSNFADKTKCRNSIAHEVAMRCGTPYHFCFPVRVHLNGAFHGVMDLMEDGDDRMLERNGLDPEGAFYKMYNELKTDDGATPWVTNVEKKTRLNEDNTDLQTLVTSLDPALDLATRRAYAYDNLDIPATINYMVVRQLNSDKDHGHKNYFLYRDTNRSREWRPIIWDVDLSWGHNWNSSETYFDDDLWANNPLNCHSSFNRLYNIILETPEFREMWVRRMRSLMDTILQAPGTTNGLLETRLRAITASVDPDPAVSVWTDGDLDATRWGIDSRFLQNRPREEAERVITGYLIPRRTFLFDQGATRPLLYKPGLTPDATNSTAIPDLPQDAGAGSVTVDSLDFYPSSTSQAGEYLILRNNTANAIDVSGWRLSGAVDFIFPGGTVIPSGAGTPEVEYKGLLHVAKDAYSFRSRTSGPTGGQKRLVVGNYDGQLSARGETVRLRDTSDAVIASFTYAGSPTALQQSLRVTEIQYHPSEPTSAEASALPGVTADDFEYIEFANIGGGTITLSNATFTQGLLYTFPSGTTLAPGARLLLVRNATAFNYRYPGVAATKLGPYDGKLDNAGERLEITDPSGEVILDFEYKDGWYPASDGNGRSLVLRNPATDPGDFGSSVSWGLSLGAAGNPGVADPVLAQAYYGWDNFHFTESERDDALVSGPEADPDQDGATNLREYAFGRDPRKSDDDGIHFDWAQVSSSRYPAVSFLRPRNSIDLTYELLAADSPQGPWTSVGSTIQEMTVVDSTTERVVLRTTFPSSGLREFLRVRATLAP